LECADPVSVLVQGGLSPGRFVNDIQRWPRQVATDLKR